MALLQPFMVKNALGNNDLELEAKPGESLLVKDIWAHYAAEHFLTITIGKTTVGYFRTRSNPNGAHIFRLAGWQRHSHGITLNLDQAGAGTNAYPIRNVRGEETNYRIQATPGGEISGNYRVHEAVQRVGDQRNEALLTYLKRMAIFNGYPVAEGETFKITGVKHATNPSRQVVQYEVHEAGDMTREQENGSRSNTYFFLNYGNCGGNINVNGDSLYTTSVSPAEFPSFPFDAVVPANTEIEIIGILASPVAPKENDDTHYTYTRYLKLVKDREVLFDEDRNGIIFENRQLDLTGRADSIAQGFSLIGNKSEYDANDPLIFDPPLKFVAGDELNIYVTTVRAEDGQNISITQHEICLIERVTRLT